MLNEFYNFIAKKINSFFQTAASDGIMLKGESFCLKLDDQEMVFGVFNALKMLALNNQSIGNYVYLCSDGSEYTTYTLKVIDDEIIIAAQIEGMTNEFLGATLRNVANQEKKPILMISTNLIDSAKSGTRDLSARNMPFYPEQLMHEIREEIDKNTYISDVDKRILKFELTRRNEDVFSDKKAIFEYCDLLSVISSGNVDVNNFQNFRLFNFDTKKAYENYGTNQIDQEIKKNNELFEKIDRGIRVGNLEEELGKILDENTISEIEEAYKKDTENWSKQFSYTKLQVAMERKQAKMDNPLKIDEEDIIVYGDLPLNVIDKEKAWFRNQGSQTAKKRNKNILIFNSDNYSLIHVKVACNVKVANNSIFSDNTKYLKEGKNIIFEFNSEGIAFHRIKITDTINGIEYIFKICIVDILPQYLGLTVKYGFFIDYTKVKKNCRIKLIGIGTDLIFNSSASLINSFKLEDNGKYKCKYDEGLCINVTEEELSNLDSGIKIYIDFAGIVVPFILYPDEKKSVEIIGRKILKEKLTVKHSFSFVNDAIISGSQEYFAKANLLRELRVEQEFVDKEILAGKIRDFYDSSTVKIIKDELNLTGELKNAYLEMLAEFKAKGTIPTLAYLGGDLLDYVKKYLQAFKKCFINLQDGENLSLEQEGALYLGTICLGESADEILFTPFHPLNLEYQLALLQEKEVASATDVVMDRLNSVNLLPYIQRKKRVYKVSDQLFSKEWKYYAPVDNVKYGGSRRYVPRLVEEKISEFISHFRYVFNDIKNNIVRINLINMGDCREVFIGLAQFFIHSVKYNVDEDNLIKFEIHIYTGCIRKNVFYYIREYRMLKEFLLEQKLSIIDGTSMNSLEGILSKNVECYFHKDNGKTYEYAHISFYEMESEITSGQATMNQIETGISMGGILSGIPSSRYGQKYRTGYGTKYAESTSVVKLATMLNALMQVEESGNPYQSGTSISTQIDEIAENKMDFIYKNSNWVVFVDPKVDLDFFSKAEINNDLLIIHYSDQYTSSSGYDAITVTHKSKQYSMVIKEYLKEKGIKANDDDVHKIINLFNAVNGNWLLKLVSSKRENKDSMFTREKISIVAAIKFMLAFLRHEDIVWVPISLEELLRVSGSVGLSRDEGILSAKNLGFEKGPTSDDLLFMGLNKCEEIPKIYLYPVEVKTGNNDSGIIKKAFEQVSSTAEGFHIAVDLDNEIVKTILYKVNRNFLIQMFVASCKKMQVYHIDDTQNWNVILDNYREAILNEKYIISDDIQKTLGKGAVLSFKKAFVEGRTSLKEGAIRFIEMSEGDEFGLILKTVSDIYDEIRVRRDHESLIAGDYLVRKPIYNFEGSVTKLDSKDAKIFDEKLDGVDLKKNEECTESNGIFGVKEKEIMLEKSESKNEDNCIQIIFGCNNRDGKPVIWKPNDTRQLFHTNTGIIGTMGTGKTQFTKSLILQLYKEQMRNVGEQPLGILVFDYKGDYNETKVDFIESTNAKVYKPYQLPFNPLALTRSAVYKPLLPTHTASAFKDIISKVYNLGPKQEAILLQCIMDTYIAAGIIPSNPSTWDNEAPTFDQVYQRYIHDEEIRKGDSLTVALNKLNMFKIFESDPSKTSSLFGILDGVVVIDLSGYDSDIQSLIVEITLNLFYSQMQAMGSSRMEGDYRQLTKMILVDEADNFMSEGFTSLKKILKEGREFGVGTILSTQFLKHFGGGEEDYSKYILTWIVHNVSDLKNSDVDFVFKTESKSQESLDLFNTIKNLDKHHSIIKIGNSRPVYVKDKAFWELYQELH